MTRLPTRIAPSLTSSKPAIMRKVEVLPQPDEPRRPTISPSSIVHVDALDGASRLARAVDLAHTVEREGAMSVLRSGRSAQARTCRLIEERAPCPGRCGRRRAGGRARTRAPVVAPSRWPGSRSGRCARMKRTVRTLSGVTASSSIGMLPGSRSSSIRTSSGRMPSMQGRSGTAAWRPLPAARP